MTKTRRKNVKLCTRKSSLEVEVAEVVIAEGPDTEAYCVALEFISNHLGRDKPEHEVRT